MKESLKPKAAVPLLTTVVRVGSYWHSEKLTFGMAALRKGTLDPVCLYLPSVSSPKETLKCELEETGTSSNLLICAGSTCLLIISNKIQIKLIKTLNSSLESFDAQQLKSAMALQTVESGRLAVRADLSPPLEASERLKQAVKLCGWTERQLIRPL